MKFGFWYVMRKWHYSTWVVHYITLQKFKVVFSTYIRSKRARLVDIGCGGKPYRDLIACYFDKHIGLEYPSPFHTDDAADVYGSAYHTALKSDSVNTVFMGAVLEHLEDPARALQEAHRIMAPDGLLILTAPLFWQLHDLPRDFYRYTEHGLNYLFESNGFDVQEIVPLSGFWITLGSLCINYISGFNKGILKKVPIIPAIIIGIEFGTFFLSKGEKKSSVWTWAYCAVGTKKTNH